MRTDRSSTNRKAAVAAALFVLVGLFVPATASGATTSGVKASAGSISGWVGEARVPARIGDVCVKAKGPSTGSAVSAHDGSYTIGGLLPGKYTVTANPACSKEPYLPATRTGIVVKAGARTHGVAVDLRPRNNKIVGIVPPADPASNCAPAGGPPAADINQCRGLEGVGPLVLPSNFAKLGPVEQMLVIFNLERVNRGLPPVVGLSAALDKNAQQGADQGTDPVGPPGYGWGSIWAGGYGSIELADWGWMYADGYHSGNEDCSTPAADGCWGHRDNILAPTSGIVGGGALATGSKAPYGWSAAFLFVFGYPSTHLVFRWSSELKYFKSPPRAERAGVPTLASLSPGSGSTSGGTLVKLRGTRLWGVTAIHFGPHKATRDLHCSGTVCTVLAPPAKAGRVAVSVTTVAGTSAVRTPDHFTYR